VAAHQVEGLHPEAHEVVEMHHVGPQLLQQRAEAARQRRVRVGVAEVVVARRLGQELVGP
jgi:hypothetical protein